MLDLVGPKPQRQFFSHHASYIPLNFLLAFLPGSVLDPVGHHISVLPYVVLKLLDEKYSENW